MTEKDKEINNVNVKIGGDASGNIIIGDENKVSIDQSQIRVGVTNEELNELLSLIDKLKSKINNEADDDKKQQALERVDELVGAMEEKKPDLGTMEYVSRWFSKNLPKIAGTVTGIIVHPIVGKLVQAAGDAAVEEFNRRFRS